MLALLIPHRRARGSASPGWTGGAFWCAFNFVLETLAASSSQSR
jgi:hypothetical protein